MTQKQRLEVIRQTVQQQKKVVVSVLAEQFEVTEETIRRDLDKLEAEGLVARTYGGAVLNAESNTENLDFIRRERKHSEEKLVIANLTEELLSNNITIGCDASSTVVAALTVLKDRKTATVFTYSAQAVSALEDSELRVISSGGILERQTLSFGGPIAKKTLASYYTDVALFSCKALNLEGGIYDSNEEETELKKILISHAQKRILLADHSKFDRLAFVHLSALDSVNTIVTDRKPSDAWVRALAAKGIELVYPAEEA
ncbi:MAG: DeoR/GlpR family DNA-binding transcription regulator [Lachnospiraceae bacterium]|nr:DeoR/GlpR family DNA-binding transcription regulator [Lachnospiraceae bacterium]